MKTGKKLALVALLAGMSCAAVAAPVAYEFETVTGLKLDAGAPSVTGVLRNSATPTTVEFIDQTNISYRYIVNRCVPVFMTMMEKPGKYYLTLVIEPTQQYVQLISCELQLRP